MSEGKRKRKRVLVCPMDWGLGHAARCVPIIRKLIEKNAEVIIAADNQPIAFLKKEFPELKFLRFPSYRITYPSNGSMVFRMLLSIPKILRGIKQEHALLEQIIKENNIDIVISDNRYGLWNDKVYTVFITHQILIKCPAWMKMFEPVLAGITRKLISRYNECWIPDLEGDENLSGDLSHKYSLPQNAHYIGLLSRFDSKVKSSKNDEKIDVLIILSGPEPQRTKLEEKLLSGLQLPEFNLNKYNVVLVRGIYESTDNSQFSNLQSQICIYSHLETEKLHQFIDNSELILCRSGYSGIMDLAVMGKKAVFIPTPGQTEQEYLAEYLFRKKLFYYMKQNDFDLSKAIKASEDYNGIQIRNDESKLDERIEKVLSIKF